LNVSIVIPAKNEAEGLARVLPELTRDFADAEIIVVNDGSTDATEATLQALAQQSDQIQVLSLPRNMGKAEAVRRGMLAAFDGSAELVGWWDGDLATPLPEIDRFVARFHDQPTLEAVLGSRVKMMGRHIERRPARHYAGRAAATLAVSVLNLPIYDTQCGAKVFRVTPHTTAAFHRPFLTKWTFDVEVLARLVEAWRPQRLDQITERMEELPLRTWHDVDGSKVTLRDFLRAPRDLLTIALRHRAFRGHPWDA